MSIGDYLVLWLALFCWGANASQLGGPIRSAYWAYVDWRGFRNLKRLGKRRPVPALQRKSGR